MAGILILCATPIGNLGDAPPRLAETLGSADVVYAEDTRRTSTLLAAIGVSVPLVSFFAGNERERLPEIEQRLGLGETVALVTDAGVPSVSDPGLTAVRVARQVGATVTVVPGPSAVTTAVAVSGLPADRFVFEGFLPRRGGDRARRLADLAVESRTIVLFCSPHRALDDLVSLAEALGPDRPMCVARELTKLHEEVWWGTLGEAVTEWSEREPRGEFTLVVAGADEPEPDLEAAIATAHRLMEEGVSRSQAARQAAAEHRVDRRELYDVL